MLKYEQEMRYIVRVKDQHYDEMMTAKDAKIMNLIEGTDFQALLIKHEMEMEQLRRKHAEDIEARLNNTKPNEPNRIIADVSFFPLLPTNVPHFISFCVAFPAESHRLGVMTFFRL